MRSISHLTLRCAPLLLITLLVGCAADLESSPTGASGASLEELRRRPCRVDADCPAPGLPCRECADGDVACPDVECQHHRCVYQFPQCEPEDPCAAVRCAAGTHCESGSCVPDTRVFCGGIAGIPCPDGSSCVDDPSDDCDPNRGGADCGGMCVCTELALCVQGYHWDGDPSVCACVPDQPQGVSCGGNTCAAGQYCCNASCGICAPKGAACIQIACEATR